MTSTHKYISIDKYLPMTYGNRTMLKTGKHDLTRLNATQPYVEEHIKPIY